MIVIKKTWKDAIKQGKQIYKNKEGINGNKKDRRTIKQGK